MSACTSDSATSPRCHPRNAKYRNEIRTLSVTCSGKRNFHTVIGIRIVIRVQTVIIFTLRVCLFISAISVHVNFGLQNWLKMPQINLKKPGKIADRKQTHRRVVSLQLSNGYLPRHAENESRSVEPVGTPN